MSFEDIIEQDLADFNRLIALLIVGVTRDRLIKEFPRESRVAGRSVRTYVNDLIEEGSLAETGNGKIKYRCSPL